MSVARSETRSCYLKNRLKINFNPKLLHFVLWGSYSKNISAGESPNTIFCPTFEKNAFTAMLFERPETKRGGFEKIVCRKNVATFFATRFSHSHAYSTKPSFLWLSTVWTFYFLPICRGTSIGVFKIRLTLWLAYLIAGQIALLNRFVVASFVSFVQWTWLTRYIKSAVKSCYRQTTRQPIIKQILKWLLRHKKDVYDFEN